MLDFDPSEHPHRRFNPLTQDWVLCSPHRTKRPWQGQVEPPEVPDRPKHDPKCYLCPGNSRAGGAKTDNYTSTYIFENDFAALMEPEVANPPAGSPLHASLYRTQTARGKCFVICFNPRHDLTIAELPGKEIVPILDAIKLYRDVSTQYPFIKYIQIFENKGSMMGCSNPHPHGQTWTLDYVPTLPARILQSQRDFAASELSDASMPTLKSGHPSLLLSYAHSELNPEPSPRVIFKTKHFLACVPYWAVWPFECMLLPHSRHIPSIAHLTDEEREDLADALGRLTCRLDNLFSCSFAYSMGVNQASTLGDESEDYAQLHISFYPPLLRSSTVRKFLVGFELFAEAQRDLTPEQGALKIRDCSEAHYKTRL